MKGRYRGRREKPAHPRAQGKRLAILKGGGKDSDAARPVRLEPGEYRLQKVLAAAGVASRRAAEAMILAGRVSVNGRIVTVLGTKVDPGRDRVAVDGKPLPLQGEPLRYIIFHKPYGCLSTFTDPEGRPTLARFIQVPERVYSVGRLDFNSEGLLLLTNDGALTHRLTHPRYEHPKEYLVQVEGIPTEEALAALRQGVRIKGRLTAPAEVERLAGYPEGLVMRPVRSGVPTTWLRIVIHEGRKRQIRHMTAAVGYPTLRLVRAGLGPLRLGDLPPGQWRDLTAEELAALKRFAFREGTTMPDRRAAIRKGRVGKAGHPLPGGTEDKS